MSAGPYSIGSTIWPGLSKVSEEMGELGQVLGKLLGTGGVISHWDGSNLKDRLIEEIGDLSAALRFFVEENNLDADALGARHDQKLALFRKWHDAQTLPPGATSETKQGIEP
jgi:hypothetical protein